MLLTIFNGFRFYCIDEYIQVHPQYEYDRQVAQEQLRSKVLQQELIRINSAYSLNLKILFKKCRVMYLVLGLLVTEAL